MISFRKIRIRLTSKKEILRKRANKEEEEEIIRKKLQWHINAW